MQTGCHAIAKKKWFFSLQTLVEGRLCSQIFVPLFNLQDVHFTDGWDPNQQTPKSIYVWTTVHDELVQVGNLLMVVLVVWRVNMAQIIPVTWIINTVWFDLLMSLFGPVVCVLHHHWKTQTVCLNVVFNHCLSFHPRTKCLVWWWWISVHYLYVFVPVTNQTNKMSSSMHRHSSFVR